MSILDILFGSKKKRTLENSQSNKQSTGGQSVTQKGGVFYALTGYKPKNAREEEQEGMVEVCWLENLKKLKIKRYKESRETKFDHRKDKLKVGDNFILQQDLLDTIYRLAHRNSYFKRFLGCRFDREDRLKLQFILKRNSYLLQQAARRLNHRDEERREIVLGKYLKYL